MFRSAIYMISIYQMRLQYGEYRNEEEKNFLEKRIKELKQAVKERRCTVQ